MSLQSSQPQFEQSDEDESFGEFAITLEALFPPCNHNLKDGDQVIVLDPFRAHVRSYDIGVPAVIETIDCHDIDDSHEVYLVWPSGTGLWVDIDNVRVVGS